MKVTKIVIAIVLTLALASPVSGAPFYLSDEFGLNGFFLCDGKDGFPHEARWQNGTGRTISIKQFVSGIGVSRGGVGDVWFFITKLSDLSPVTNVWWDHYEDPVGPLNVFHTLVTPIDIAPGHGLLIEFYCDAKIKKAPAYFHMIITAYD